MNFNFCYVLADWEGLIYNDRMFENALFTKDFQIPDGKYYLTDA